MLFCATLVDVSLGSVPRYSGAAAEVGVVGGGLKTLSVDKKI
jgi:hypothetical protein